MCGKCLALTDSINTFPFLFPLYLLFPMLTAKGTVHSRFFGKHMTWFLLVIFFFFAIFMPTLFTCPHPLWSQSNTFLSQNTFRTIWIRLRDMKSLMLFSLCCSLGNKDIEVFTSTLQLRQSVSRWNQQLSDSRDNSLFFLIPDFTKFQTHTSFILPLVFFPQIR